MSAGFWTEVAKLADPPSSGAAASPRPRPGVAEQEPGGSRHGSAEATTDQPSTDEAQRDERGANHDTPARHDGSAAHDAGAETAAAAPPDGVLVPLDTWTRVMDQLGNLHQAGQDLAEARERAARAETQVEFLKRQLADEKARRRSTTRAAAADTARPSGAQAQAPASPTAPPQGPAAPEIDLRAASRARVASARNRVSSWLRTD